MANLLPENETIQFEDQLYVNPETSLNEQTAFIDNLRNVQNQNNAEIKLQTENLGTYPSPQSTLGGLTGGEGYFTARYQTPQSVSLAANLRTAAQAQALNDVLQNEMAIAKQRYNNAYKAARQRAAARAASYGGSSGGGGGGTGNVDYENLSNRQRKVGSVEPSYSPMGSGDFSYTSVSEQLSNGGVLPNNIGAQIPGPTNNLAPSGNVNIQRNKWGDITSLTYNGKTYTGAAAEKQYQVMQANGTIGGKE